MSKTTTLLPVSPIAVAMAHTELRLRREGIETKVVVDDDGMPNCRYFDKTSGLEVATPNWLTGEIKVEWREGPNKIFDLGTNDKSRKLEESVFNYLKARYKKPDYEPS